MLKTIKTVVFLVLAVNLFLMPFFVLAKECYVNVDKDNGDGSKEKPYHTIKKALEQGCNEVRVAKGEYSESLILPVGAKLEGKGERTVITGEVMMSDKTKMTKMYVKGKKVVVMKNARATINQVTIAGAPIGIRTEEYSKLDLSNSTITRNKSKGLYLRYQTRINLDNNKIIKNNGEGVDIRAGVKGNIKHNIINDNKESGIELIIGGSNLSITNNIIKNNKASGLALQFYRESSQLGHIKIAGNTIMDNGNYAIDCKRPSGGHPKSGYWSKSTDFAYNKIKGKLKREFSLACKFTNSEMDQARKTTEEINGEKEAEDKDKTMTAQEKEEKERLKKEAEEKRLREQQKRIDLELKDRLEQTITKNETICDYSASVGMLKQRKAWIIFFLGPKPENIQVLQKKERECNAFVARMDGGYEKIKDKEIKDSLQKDIENIHQAQKIFSQKLDKYKNKFGLWSWLKNLFRN